jgi:hypothetical protein
MKRIGLLGGMRWESSAEYYRLINQATRDRLGGLHSADCPLRSVDFAEIEQLQRNGDWERAGDRLVREAVALQAAGTDLLVLCTNTIHKGPGDRTRDGRSRPRRERTARHRLAAKSHRMSDTMAAPHVPGLGRRAHESVSHRGAATHVASTVSAEASQSPRLLVRPRLAPSLLQRSCNPAWAGRMPPVSAPPRPSTSDPGHWIWAFHPRMGGWSGQRSSW